MDDPRLPAVDPTAPLSDDDRARLKAELKPGERVLWASGSRHDPMGDDEGCLLPVAGAAMMSWVVGVGGILYSIQVEQPGGTVGTVLGVSGLVFAFLFTFGTFVSAWSGWQNRGQRKRRLYALTDARAIFWEPGDGRSVVVSHLPHGQIRRVWRVEHPDGAGDVVFRASVPGPQPEHQQTFFGVPDFRRAEDLARTLHQQARPSRRKSGRRHPLQDDDRGDPSPEQDPRP